MGIRMRFFIVLIQLNLTLALFSNDFFSQNLLSSSGRNAATSVWFEVQSGKITFEGRVLRQNTGTSSWMVDSITNDDIELNDNGYFYVKIFGNEYSVLFGSRFFFIPYDKKSDYPRDRIGTVFQSNVDDLIKSRANQSDKNIDSIDYIRTMIKSIKASSSLIEGNTEYKTFFLNKYLVKGEGGEFFNSDAIPWVEGVSGPGIGETLEISFSDPSSDIVILNGFVDPTRKHLYRNNNRVKTAIIRSNDSGEHFEFEHTFEDVVHFDEIQFPRPAEKIIFEIKDVYPGEKWDDTCISAVLTREPDPYK